MATTTAIGTATRSPFLIYNADGSSRVPRDYKTAVAQETANGTMPISAARMQNLKKEGRLHVAYAGSRNEKIAKQQARAAAANAGSNLISPPNGATGNIFADALASISQSGSAFGSTPASSFVDTSTLPGGSKNYTGVLILAGGVAFFMFGGMAKLKKFI